MDEFNNLPRAAELVHGHMVEIRSRQAWLQSSWLTIPRYCLFQYNPLHSFKNYIKKIDSCSPLHGLHDL